MPFSRTSFSKGMDAEHRAKAFLEKKGYSCAAHRYKTRDGEIDLIVEKDGILVFVEVKSRASFREGLFSLFPRQCRRILNAAHCFLQTQETSWQAMRFDLVIVKTSSEIMHLENIITL
jgi:putative endonuclease